MIYTKPINEITWDDVEIFCQQQLEEGAYLDYKEDFPKNLEKTISAMANTLGGIIIIGVKEDNLNRPVIPIKGIQFQKGLSERVTNIILTNITPPVFPEIAVCPDKSVKKVLLVIRIQQSHQTPHAIAKNTMVYLRTGNRNKPEERATINDIEWLQDNRKKSEKLRMHLYKLAEDRFNRFYLSCTQREVWVKKGLQPIHRGWLMLSICPLFPQSVYCTPPDLIDIYNDIKVPDGFYKQKFFPISEYGDAEIVQDGVMINNPLNNKYFFHALINCCGLYYYKQNLLRERSEEQKEVMYKSEILHRLNEFLLSAEKWYKIIGYWGVLEIRMTLDKMDGCGLYLEKKDWFHEENIRFSVDDEIGNNELVSANILFKDRFDYILRLYQKISWAFGIDTDKDEILSFFKVKK